MKRYLLSSLSIEGFRGINNEGDPLVLKFKPETVNSVHAPNGVGKSSIFEALYFAIYGQVPRLTEMQDSERGESYIVNRFHPSRTATIQLVFTSDDGSPDVEICVTQQHEGVRAVSSPTGHSAPEEFLEQLQEDFVLIDYSQFTKFIETTALVRGRSFASLVGLSKYSKLRQALEAAERTPNINADFELKVIQADVTNKESNQNNVASRMLESHNSVTGKEEVSTTNTDSLVHNVTAALSEIELLQPLLKGISVQELDFEAAENVIEREEGGDARKKIDQLNTAINKLKQIELSSEEEVDAAELLKLADNRDASVDRVGKVPIQKLLEEALIVVSSNDWPNTNECPVCESHLTQPLTQKLESKLELYRETDQLNGELISSFETARCFSKLVALEEAQSIGIQPEERLHPKLTLEAKEGVLSTANLVSFEKRLKKLENLRLEKLEASTLELGELQKKLPPSLVEVSRKLSSAKQFCAELSEFLDNQPKLADKKKQLEKVLRWRGFIKRVSEKFAAAETELSNARISEIQESCQELFAKLVRGGPDVKPTLKRAEDAEKVDLKLADFFGLEDLSARALLSESYRNAVAASIFLSAATKHSGVPRFMVLDDVTSSFDAGHQFALMDALRGSLRYGVLPEGLQFIVLSHDTSLEKYFDRLGSTAEWHHQKLQGMPPKGRLMVSSQEAERLKGQAEQHLNAGMLSTGEPFVRQYVEYKLGQVISKVQIPVPPDYATRGDKRTLSTYLDAIIEAVKIFDAANCCALTPQQITNARDLHGPSIMANYVSHYETGAGNPFNSYALLGVLQTVDDFADCFKYIDPSNGQLRYYRRLKI